MSVDQSPVDQSSVDRAPAEQPLTAPPPVEQPPFDQPPVAPLVVEPPPAPRRSVTAITLLIIVPLCIGALLSLLIPRPAIGVIRFNDVIYSYSAQEVIAQITYARENPAIRAVVLDLDSPGGSAVESEALFHELSRLRETKPVVTVINEMAASGGYYMAVGTDYIYAKSSSDIGNIGVIGILPMTPLVFEEVISTGPYKLWGAPRDATQRRIEMIKQTFYAAVKEGRGTALKVDAETLLRGEVWPGTIALQMGLIDAIGSRSHALDHAAQMARIANYEVIDLYTKITPSEPPAFIFGLEEREVKTAYPRDPGMYMLYVPTSERRLP